MKKMNSFGIFLQNIHQRKIEKVVTDFAKKILFTEIKTKLIY